VAACTTLPATPLGAIPVFSLATAIVLRNGRPGRMCVACRALRIGPRTALIGRAARAAARA